MRLVLIPLLALVLAACDSDGTDLRQVVVFELSHDRAALVGTWDLISVTSAGYGAPPATTPASALGWTESYTFRADGTVDVFRDGQQVESTVYAVEDLPDSGRTPLLRIGTETDYRREYFGIDGDRLYFDHRPSDGDLLEFARR